MLEQRRLSLAFYLAVWVAILEPVSWLTSRVPPCIVDAASYGSYYTEHKECPAFHVFLIKIAAAIFEKLGDPNWATALAIVAIAAFTATLWWSTRGMLRATNKSLQLARDEFVATHRPRLRVRSVTKIGNNPVKSIRVRFALVNVGDSPANLIEARVLIDYARDRPPIDFGGVGIEPTGRFKPGEARLYLVSSPRKELVSREEERKGHRLFVYGRVVYQDDLGTSRTTSFCRHWDAEANCFRLVDDREYEYED